MADIVTREELDLIQPILPESRTFSPIAHIKIADFMLNLGADILKGYTLVSETYSIARNGSQCFSVLTYSRGDDGINFSIGWRNSTDKSLAIGICLGASVICCSNLMFDGDIKILRRHSMNAWSHIETLAITSFYKHQHSYDRLIENSLRLKRLPVNDNQIARWLGLLFYRGVISPRQLPVALSEWQKPSFPEFEPRTAFSALNAVTYALKTSPPSSVLESHAMLNKSVIDI